MGPKEIELMFLYQEDIRMQSTYQVDQGVRGLANNITRQNSDILNLDIIMNTHTLICILYILIVHILILICIHTQGKVCVIFLCFTDTAFCKLKIHGNCGLSDHG